MTGGGIQPRDARGHRASDADRDRVATVLGQHLAEGRLTVDEHSERLQLVYSARTVGELDVVTRDLPQAADERARPAPRTRRRRSSPARRAFQIHVSVYGIINAFLTSIYVITDFGGYFWPIWPAMGWGVAVAIQGAATYFGEGEAEQPVEPSAAPPPPPAQRTRHHWVAVMFTDIANSTPLTEALGDAEWSRLRTRHREMLRELFSEHDGSEVGSQGDGFLARFRSPADGVRCAVAIQRRLEHMRDQGAVVPKVRIGLHAGETVAEDDGDVIGRVVNLASRVTGEAEPGEILVTEPVADHAGSAKLEDRGLRSLRGVATPRHLLAVRWD